MLIRKVKPLENYKFIHNETGEEISLHIRSIGTRRAEIGINCDKEVFTFVHGKKEKGNE